MRITVIGTGYVGLVSGACFADLGHNVTCVDKDKSKIDGLLQGRVPIYEPGLDGLVAKNVEQRRLSFTTDLAGSVSDADVILIAVGTPQGAQDGSTDLRYVLAVAEELAPRLQSFTVIIIKSTVPVGTGEKVENVILSMNPKAAFSVVSNPEFLREGAAILDFKQPDRIVIGTEDDRSKKVMGELYAPMKAAVPIIYTSRKNSELIKYAANAFLAMKVAYINEIADVCESVGADVGEVAKGIGLDRRIGSRFLAAGPGYGGSCFPKDTASLAFTGRSLGRPLSLIEATISSNEMRKQAMADKILATLGASSSGSTVTVLGVTFKADTDDMRDAPSLVIIPKLLAAGINVRVCDPGAGAAARGAFPTAHFHDDLYEAAQDADAVVLLTEWNMFRELDLVKLKARMRGTVFVDLRRLVPEKNVTSAGLRYVGVGVADASPVPAVVQQETAA